MRMMKVIYSVYESSRAGTHQDVLSFRVEGEEATSRNLNLKILFTNSDINEFLNSLYVVEFCCFHGNAVYLFVSAVSRQDEGSGGVLR